MKIWTMGKRDHVIIVLRDLTYKNWRFNLKAIGDVAYALQIAADECDNVTGAPATWFSRKWLLDPDMTDGEIVQTAFKAVMTAEEHEARELFKYQHVAVLDPHYDVNKLRQFRQSAGAVQERAKA